MKRLFRSKIFWTVLILILAIRLLAPPLILKEANNYLENFSPIFKAHIAEIHLGVFRGAYQARGIEVRLKEKPQEQPLYLKTLDVSIAWREIFKGQLTADVLLDGLKIVVTKNVITALKDFSQVKKDQKNATNKLVPLRIERIDIRDSDFEVADFPQIPEKSRVRLTDIQGRVSNVTSTPSAPLTLASVRGDFFDSAPVKAAIQINRLAKPLAWDVDLEMKDFKLKEANPFLYRKLPLTFTSGTLDVYSEMKSENGKIEGYLKPFLNKADVIRTNEEFKSVRHFGIEITSAALNLLFRDSKDKTLATKILFSYDKGGFKVNSAKALNDAFKNGFTEQIPPGIEDQISLSAFHQKAAEKGDKP